MRLSVIAALLSVALATVFCLRSAEATSRGPTDELKGVKLISYFAISEPGLAGNGCDVDTSRLDTSLAFVANQSTQLKLIPAKQHMDTAQVLYNKARSLHDAKGPNKEVDDAEREAREYNFAPQLTLFIAPMQASPGRCAVSVRASVTAYTTPAELLATRRRVQSPQIEIWYSGYNYVGPQASISNEVADICTQIMKELVNDWSESQRDFQ